MKLESSNRINGWRHLQKRIAALGVVVLLSVCAAAMPRARAETISNFAILEKLQSDGKHLAKETQKWMGRWQNIDLDNPEFVFKDLSGSTSINLKVRKADPTDEKGYKPYGSFVPRNGAANPDTEIAYFNLAAILGYDGIFRPTVP